MHWPFNSNPVVLSNFESQVSHLRLNMVALSFMGIRVSESLVSPQVQ